MCGRYLIDDEAYADILMILNNLNAAKRVYSNEDFMSEQYIRGEVFPSNIAPVFDRSGVLALQWGFPHWKNSSVIINARAETAAEKNMFRKPLRERRCVVPSSGFYEWSRSSSRRRRDKYLFTLPDKHIVYMAGIVGTFKNAAGEKFDSFAILTTAANNSVAAVHDRMPVLLTQEEIDSWIHDDTFSHFALNRIGQELMSTVA